MSSSAVVVPNDAGKVKEDTRGTFKEAVVVVLAYTFIIAVVKQQLPSARHMFLFLAGYVPAVAILKSVHEDLAKNISNALAISLGTVFVKACFTQGGA